MNDSGKAAASVESAGSAVPCENQGGHAVPPASKLCGILVRRPRWGLSWSGRLLVLAVTLIMGYVLTSRIHPFLCVTDRADTDVLVVEGWIDGYALRAGVSEFKKGSYKRVFTTGGPIVGDGPYVNDFRTSASVGADGLKRFGVPANLVQIVACHENGRDRTYQSAVALREWFHQRNLTIHSFNLLTEDCHGQRSRLLFQMAFGNEVKVGIISVPNTDYDAARWWRYSEGVRQVLSESVAYVYAKVFFYP